MNQRRALLAAVGTSALAAQFAVLAQQPGTPSATAAGKVWRVGFLGAGSRPAADRPDANIDAFMYEFFQCNFTIQRSGCSSAEKLH